MFSLPNCFIVCTALWSTSVALLSAWEINLNLCKLGSDFPIEIWQFMDEFIFIWIHSEGIKPLFSHGILFQYIFYYFISKTFLRILTMFTCTGQLQYEAEFGHIWSVFFRSFAFTIIKINLLKSIYRSHIYKGLLAYIFQFIFQSHLLLVRTWMRIRVKKVLKCAVIYGRKDGTKSISILE